MDSARFILAIQPFFISLGIHALAATLLYFGGLGTGTEGPSHIGGGTFEIIGFQKATPQTDKKSKKKQASTQPSPDSLAKTKEDVGSNKEENNNSQSGFSSHGGGGSAYNQYVQKLYNHLEQNKRYPLFARKLKVQGVVGVRFRVLRDGTIEDIQITKPSHSEILNRAAMESLRKSSGQSPLPASIKGRSIRVETSFHFSTPSR